VTTLLQQISADLATYYDASRTFAESVTGPSGVLLGIFSREYLQADAGGFVPASSSAPVLRTRDADAMAKGANVTIRGTTYVVVEVQPNGYDETIHRLQLLES
jgi:hypothetical protein